MKRIKSREIKEAVDSMNNTIVGVSARHTIKVKQLLCRLSDWLQRSVTTTTRAWCGVLVVVSVVAYSLLNLDVNPWSWVLMSSGVQVACLCMRGWSSMDVWERRIFLWSVVSILSFIHFLLMDPTFIGWESVYHFCSGPSSGARRHGFQGNTESFVYCTMNFRWNMAGWRKAISLWNFMLSGALGVQRLCIEIGFGGLLPGEEAIPRECFVSIIWRLVPFWLNKWESNFGAECSSILFELPHFALELLVILPSVQIMAGRMRVLAHAPAQIRNVPGMMMVPDVMACRWIVDGSQVHFWERLRKNTRSLMVIGLITCCAACNAIFMPLYLEHRAVSSEKSVSYAGYREVLSATGLSSVNWKNYSLGEHFDDTMIRLNHNTTTYACAVSNLTDCKTTMQRDMVSWMLQHKALNVLSEQGTDQEAENSRICLLNLTMSTGSPLWILNMLEKDIELEQNDTSSNSTELFQHVAFGEYFYGTEVDTNTSFIGMQKQYMNKAMKNRRRHAKGSLLSNLIVGIPPKDASSFHAVARKHAVEYERMTSKEHKNLVPLVELALAIMRLSCERWFSLMAVFTSFIIFRDPPAYVQKYIRILATMCRLFQQTIIMSFPAVCWGYGAGFLFSMFASVVFWAGPILRIFERIKKVATEVRPVHWHAVTDAEIERMGGSCAICWGDIAVSDDVVMDEDSEDPSVDDGDRGVGLHCGHAYHKKCILEWLHSCFGQSRKATCPMCQAQVLLRVKYKFISPFRRTPLEEADRAAQDVQAPRHAAIPGLAAIAGRMPEEFRGRFDIPLAMHPPGNIELDIHGLHRPAPEAGPHHEDDTISSTSSEEYSNDERRQQIQRHIEIINPLADDTRQCVRRRDDSEHDPPVDMGTMSSAGDRTHSAHALIIEESDSENSGSSIHLPVTSEISQASSSMAESDSTESESQHEDGSSSGVRKRGPLRGIYARLRPRNWRH